MVGVRRCGIRRRAVGSNERMRHMYYVCIALINEVLTPSHRLSCQDFLWSSARVICTPTCEDVGVIAILFKSFVLMCVCTTLLNCYLKLRQWRGNVPRTLKCLCTEQAGGCDVKITREEIYSGDTDATVKRVVNDTICGKVCTLVNYPVLAGGTVCTRT